MRRGPRSVSRKRGPSASTTSTTGSSAGLRKPVGEAYPESRLLERIVAEAIPVTFSSDAHAPAEVGWGYEETVELARRCGVREFVTFEARRKVFHALPGPE